jgi:hypothetical protein
MEGDAMSDKVVDVRDTVAALGLDAKEPDIALRTGLTGGKTFLVQIRPATQEKPVLIAVHL